MPIPKYDQMYNAVLEALVDRNVHDKSDVIIYEAISSILK